jgi:outer membrane protein
MKSVLVFLVALVIGFTASAQQITKFGVVDTAKVYNAYFRNSAPIRNFEKKKAEFQAEINKKQMNFVLFNKKSLNMKMTEKKHKR